MLFHIKKTSNEIKIHCTEFDTTMLFLIKEASYEIKLLIFFGEILVVNSQPFQVLLDMGEILVPREISPMPGEGVIYNDPS